jgi:hypothetical protein
MCNSCQRALRARAARGDAGIPQSSQTRTEFPVPNSATIFLNFGGHFAAPVVMASDYSLPQN